MAIRTDRRREEERREPGSRDDTTTVPKSTGVGNKKKVLDIADCMFSFQLGDNNIASLEGGIDAMLTKCKSAATLVRRPYDAVPFTDHGEPENHGELQVMRAASNNVIDAIDDVTDFISRAKAAGFSPPSNPFSEIVRFNEDRQLVAKNRIGVTSDETVSTIIPDMINSQLADDVMFNISVLLDLIDKEKDGELSFSRRKPSDAAQIASYTISLDGFSTTNTDAETDILSFIPNIDNIKRRRIREALGALNFENRIPQLLFTSNYDPDGISRGALIGWKKIPDASGYVVERHSVFDNEEKVMKFSNENITAEYDLVKDYVNEWILSFYDKIDPDMVYAFLDKDVKHHNFYTYKLTAFQNVRTDKEFVFIVDTTPFMLSSIALNDIENEMKSILVRTFGPKLNIDGTTMRRLVDTGGFSTDDISPYPSISKKFYGDDRMDWVLAAMNMNAAIKRGETKSEVRKYSYLGAKLSFIKEKMADSKFVRPVDPNEIVQNVKDSIAAFGVSQTIVEIIRATGLDLFFESKENPADDQFRRATSIFDDTELSGMLKILSAIDPDTATVELSALTNNLIATTGDNGLTNRISALLSPQEINVPQFSEKTDEDFAEDIPQFVGDLDPSEEVLDLTTFEGLSNFVRTIRVFFDTNPNRSSFNSSDDATPDFEKFDV